MAVRTLIADHDARDRRLLGVALGAEREFEVVAECESGRSAAAAIVAARPQAALLAVDLPDITGFELLELLPPRRRPLTVFVSAQRVHAARAFELGAAGYLLKPIEPRLLRRALERIQALLDDATEEGEGEAPPHSAEPHRSPSHDRRLAVRTGRGLSLVRAEDIHWIDAAGKYARLHLEGRSHLLRTTMKALEKRLDPDRFVRIHRSTIVNADRIAEVTPRAYGDHRVVLEGGQRLNLSRGYRSCLPRLLGRVDEAERRDGVDPRTS